MGEHDDRDDVDARFRAIMAAEFGPQPSPAPSDRAAPGNDLVAPTPRQTPSDEFDLPEELAEGGSMEADDAYLPPEPDPLPRPTTAVLVGVVLMVLALATFVADLSGMQLPSPLGLIGIVSFVAGLSVLLASLPRHPRDPWDDGSRV